MEFNIEELGTTLAVGAYIIFGAEILLLAYFGSNVNRIIKAGERLGAWGSRSLVVVACFAIGMITEDLSNKFVDNINWWQEISILPAENELRSKSLFGKVPPEKFSDLTQNAAKNRLLSTYGGKHGEEIEYLINHNDKASLKKIKQNDFFEAANKLYYQAKNAVYLEDNYFAELRRIQVRIDFARSFAIISVILLFTTLILFLLKLIFPNLQLDHFPGVKFVKHKKSKTQKISHLQYIERTIGGVIIFGLLFVIGHSAYSSEEREFNSRVFGYFITLHLNGQLVTQRFPTASGTTSGISGMASIGTREFVAIHDHKDHEPFSRISLLKVMPSGYITLYALPIDWKGITPLTNDLEAICPLDKNSGEFLIAESKYRAGKFGRIFHLQIKKQVKIWQATIKKVYHLPNDTINIEGIVCHKDADGTLRLVLGERSNSTLYPVGTLREAIIKSGSDQVVVISNIPIERSNVSIKGSGHIRDISALHIDETNTLWAVRTTDNGDAGPFSSLIYPVAKWQGTNRRIEKLSPNYKKDISIIEGIKIEALAEPVVPGSRFSIASDDENYGAIWRPIW